jgi:hypothetical protein
MTAPTSSQSAPGGFAADPTEAFNPPAAGGCCGTAPAITANVSSPATASTCCGTAAEAEQSNSCCGSAAKDEAIASGAGCCG